MPRSKSLNNLRRRIYEDDEVAHNFTCNAFCFLSDAKNSGYKKEKVYPKMTIL